MKLIINKNIRLSKLCVAELIKNHFGFIVQHRNVFEQKIVLKESDMKLLLQILEDNSEFELSKLSFHIFEELTFIYN